MDDLSEESDDEKIGGDLYDSDDEEGEDEFEEEISDEELERLEAMERADKQDIEN